MSSLTLTVEQINQMNPLDIVLNEHIRNKFIQVHDTIWGEGTGEAAYERESIHFNRLLSEKMDTANKVTKFSIFTAFIDLAVCGLSLEQGTRALTYLQGRNVCVGAGPNGNKVYEPRLQLMISGYGELVLRARSGQIRHADNPVIVYEEDDFSFSDNNGQKSINYTCHLPHKSGNIVACFLRITRTDGSIDYAVMFEEDWARLAEYSAKQNTYYDKNSRQQVSRGANELYTARNGQIDTGFLMAKCIKHAFKTYPKVRIGRGTALQTEQEDPIKQDDDFYGIEDPQPAQPAPAPSFAPEPDHSAGVQIPDEPASDDGAF